MTHSSLSKAITKYLLSLPRCNVDNRQGRGAVVGAPDLCGSYKGRHFEIEVKVLPDTPSDIQKFRLKEWKEAGAICIVAYSVDDVREGLRG